MGYIEKIFCLIIPACVVIILYSIYSNNVNFREYRKEFTAVCEERGGVVYMPRGVKGWPQLECRNPNYLIEINVNK